jgi:TetR/AcrR family transcriptional repressor of mexCD-oprJ operon
MSISTHDEELLKKLAVAMTENPRGTTQDLAVAAGISRATFNRFCGTRENLVEMILKQAEQSFREIISSAKKEDTDYTKALSDLLKVHFDNQEYLLFVCQTQSSLENEYWESYLNALDAFFLSGQKAGVFQLDFPNQMMTELFVSMICGMMDANHRGRVATSGMENKMLEFFLNGISVK